MAAKPVVALRAFAVGYAAVIAAVVWRSLAPGAPLALLPWLELYWPFVGLGLGTGMLAALCALGDKLDAPSAVLWAATPIYILHQVEEWGVDLRGRPYQFYSLLTGRLGCGAECPGKLLVGTSINVLAVWVPGLLAAALGPAAAAPILGTISVNALVHIASCVHDGGAYHAGLASAVVLFLPYTVIAFRTLKHRPADRLSPYTGALAAATLLAGVAAHALLLATFAAHGRRQLTDGGGAAVVALWGAGAPLAFAALVGKRRGAAKRD